MVVLRALMVVSLLFSAAALGADKGKMTDAQRQYQADRAACMSLSDDDRKSCLREAGAALQESKRGGLTEEQAQYEKNQLARCTYLRGDDRTDCERRMRGEGTVSGSVEGGGIYRELRTLVPAPDESGSGGTKQ